MSTSFSKKALSLAVCSVMAGAIPSMAMAQESTDESAAGIEEVEVVGLRSSIRTSQDMKRMADTVKDVISAKDIGALPDKSVTEALQRVAGVTIERFAASDDPNHFADEGTGVLIRGLDRVRSEINGRGSFSANPWGGLNYEDFSPELLGAVEVIKNQTADMSAGGIAGTVNLITRKPFDSDDRMIAGTVKANYGDFREDFSPSFSGLFSDRWETSAGEFGFLISASSSELKTRGDGIGMANFSARGDTFSGTIPGWDASGTAVMGVDEDSPVDGPLESIEGGVAGTTYYVPSQTSIRTAENDRKRQGLALSAQWKNTDDSLQVTAEHIRSKASLEWRERVMGAQGQGFHFSTRSNGLYYGTEDHPLTFDENGFLQTGILKLNNELVHHSSSRYNENENTVEDTSINVKFQASDNLSFEFDYQRVDSTQTLMNNGVNSRILTEVSDQYIDLTGNTPVFEYIDERINQPVDNITRWNGDYHSHLLMSAIDTHLDADATSDRFAMDVEYVIDSGWARSVKAGVEYSDKDLTIRDTEYSNWGAINEGWTVDGTAAGSVLNNPDEFELVDLGDFYNGSALNGPTQFYFPKMSNAENFTQFLRRGCGTFSTAAHGNNGADSASQTNTECMLSSFDLGNRVGNSPFAAHDITSTNEKRTEAYVRFDFGSDDLSIPVRGNLGLRYVSYELESTGYAVLPNAPTDNNGQGTDINTIFESAYPGYLEWADGEGQISTVDGTDYSTVLPSLNVAASLTEDVVLRAGISKALYFPTMQDTRNSKIMTASFAYDRDVEGGPATAVRDLEISGVARNPNLEPEEALNMDLSLEWYFSDSGSLTVALFDKDIDNLFRERAFSQEVVNERNGLSQQAVFTGPSNEGSGSIDGFEISYTQFYDFLPGAFSGLGLQLNYTSINQSGLDDDGEQASIRFDADGNPIEADGRSTFRYFTGLPLQGYSDENYNFVAMYEKYDIEARIAYTWRSDYLVTRRDSNEFAPVYQDDYGQVDASIFYHFSDSIKAGIAATNLTNETVSTQFQLNQEGDRTQGLNFKTDTRYTFTLQMTF